MANFRRIRKPLFQGSQPQSGCKSVEKTDSRQDGFFEAAPQEIQPAINDRRLIDALDAEVDDFHQC
jgi:hypothetical protein